MNDIRAKIIEKLSQKKIMRIVDYSILIIALISFVLIAIGGYHIKHLQLEPPVDINWVAVSMMLSLIFLFSLKLFVSEKTKTAFQLILLVIVLVAMSAVVAIAKRILL